MGTYYGKISPFILGTYTWMVTIFFGLVVLDIVYARLISEATAAFSEVSDFLLLIGFLTILAALGAVVFSWTSRAARYLFAASLIVVLFEFFIPAFLGPFIAGTQDVPWLRLLPSGLASILAAIGLNKFYQAS